MSGPDHALFPCEGCGERLPAGTEVCPKCGRRLAGPSPAPRPPLHAMQPEPADYRPEPESPAARVVAGVGSCLGRLAATAGIVGASLIAFGVALFTTCSLDTGGKYLFLDLGAGVVVALLVGIALSAGFRRATRSR